MRNILLLLICLVSQDAVSQETGKGKAKKIKINFSGFVRYDVMHDSRQTVSAREGIYLLYPERPAWDNDDNDVNATSNFNFSTVNSNLKLDLCGLDLFKAETNAFFETDFWGSEKNLNHIRVRHAYFRFKWKTTELLIGQYWNPMSIPGFFPRVASSNNGVPFHPISRNPQIKLQRQIGMLKLSGYLMTQRDFTSTGPDGPDSKYLRNSGIPNIHFQVRYGTRTSAVVGGMGVDYKKIIPELYISREDGKIKTGKKNSISSCSFTGFLSIDTPVASLRLQGVYGQNSHDIQMLGGYAEKEITDPEKGEKVFANLNTLSCWADIQTTGEKIKLGIFCGYAKNKGAGKQIEGPLYMRGADIDNLFRVSPRITYEIMPLAISAEYEYTAANFGTVNGDGRGGVTDTNLTANRRCLLSFKYSF